MLMTYKNISQREIICLWKSQKRWRFLNGGGGCAVDVWVTERWWEWMRVQIRSYVGGGMHGQAGPASQCCIIAYSDRREVDLKWRTCAHCLNTLSSCHHTARLSSPNKKLFPVIPFPFNPLLHNPQLNKTTYFGVFSTVLCSYAYVSTDAKNFATDYSLVFLLLLTFCTRISKPL